MKKCPYCAELVPDDTIICSYCNHEIRISSIQSQGGKLVQGEPARVLVAKFLSSKFPPVWLSIGAIFLVFMIAGGAYLWISLKRPSACDHPYYPIQPGSEWTYSDGDTEEVRSVTGDANNARAIVYSPMVQISNPPKVFDPVTMGLPEATALSVYTCDSNGVSVNNMDWDKSRTLVPSGIVLPSENNLKPGYSWSYDAAIWMAQETVDKHWTEAQHVKCTIPGKEDLEWRGNKITTLRIDCTMNITYLDSTVDSPKTGGTYQMTDTNWYAKGIGPIQIKGWFGETLTLISYKIGGGQQQ